MLAIISKFVLLCKLTNMKIMKTLIKTLLLSTLLCTLFSSCGHEYVDLGLPSGIKWATCNVGANSPEEYGDGYAWGETEEIEDWETYKWWNDSDRSITKYCTDSYFGTVDNKTVLDPEDDVAHVKWGGDWRMPTTEEQEELINNCTWERTALKGVNGYKVTGPNGNSIFLPALDYNDIWYWSSSLCTRLNRYAWILYIDGDCYDWREQSRCLGSFVRPVCE